MNTELKCTAPNCERGMRRKKLGLCEPHAEDYRAERGEYCAHETCNRGHIKGGYCGSHYSQKQRGQELTGLGKRQQSGPVECGTSRKYGRGCRCAECKEAKRLEIRAYLDKYEAEHGEPYWTAKGRAGRKRTTYDRVCEYCGDAYTTHTYIARYCSSTCGVRDGAGWSNSREVVRWVHPWRHHTTSVPVTILPGSGTYTSGNCIICNNTFVSKYMDTTCSDDCRKVRDRDREHRTEQRRRARKKNAFVANVSRKKIFKRDGYKCHICGKRTNPNAVVPNPKAPTIDHIIPLAQNGTHEPSNVATAHFICNSRKAHTGTGDQLLLFG